ncbi:MAG: metallophosphoesterase [Planctomycetes bacterium]|nr:metallophosphoesterase [Planctomycetota bacterium]
MGTLKRVCVCSILVAAAAAAGETPYRSGTDYSFEPLLEKAVRKAGKSGPFKFVVMSDTHLGRNVPSILELTGKLKPDMVVHCGDRVNRGSGDIGEWHRMEEQLGPLARMLPFIPVEGNHEGMGGPMKTGRQRFLKFYGLEKAYYYFDAANCRFIVLSWEFNEDDEQVGWLEKTLRGGAGKHIFVCVHTPFYTVGHKSASEISNRDNRFTRMFTGHGVTMVISGHDHTYYRTDRNGVTYVVAAGAGDEKYPLERKAEAQAGDVYMGQIPGRDGKYVRLDPATGREVPEPDGMFVLEVLVKGAQVVCRAVNTSGKEYDRFEPVRLRRGARPAAERPQEKLTAARITAED